MLKCKLEEYKVFYIGGEGPTLTNFILNFNKCQVKTILYSKPNAHNYFKEIIFECFEFSYLQYIIHS